MGIRFYCPNGHKLNVKEFQAGRRGICPFCGARIQIPTQSTRPSAKAAGSPGHGPGSGPHGGGSDAQISDSAPDILPGEPPSLPGDPPGRSMLGPSTPIATTPLTPGAAKQAAVVAPPTMPSGKTGIAPTLGAPVAATAPGAATASAAAPAALGTLAMSGNVSAGNAAAHNANLAITAKPAAEAAAPAVAPPPVESSTPPEPPDPISEAPEMIWYVRPPSGGQFGPAPGELMRSWVTEGRVSADSLVWREGWRDWIEAGTVFPKLRGPQFMDFLNTAPVDSSIPHATTPTPHTPRPKSGSRIDGTFVWLILLSLATVVLIFVLIYFLRNPPQ